MGTTFVTIGRDTNGRLATDPSDEVGFWMRDDMLELWLCLLALNIRETDETSSLA